MFKNHFKIFFLLAGLILHAKAGLGQNNFSLNLRFTDSTEIPNAARKKLIDETKIYNDTLQLKLQVEKALLQLRAEGFLTAGLDSLHYERNHFTAFIYVGRKFLWGRVTQGNVPSEMMQGTGFRKKLFTGDPFRFDQLAALNKKILRNCENNGYPFASLSLDSIRIEEQNLNASLLLERNKFIRIDSIIIRGNASIAPVYIHNYIGIRPGDPYNESQVNKISNRIRELAFLRETKSSQVLFNDKENKLFLFLDNKKASQFDGVIGLLPDDTKPGKLNVTGEVHLKLQNSLKRGEIIELNWKQLPVKSQDLKVRGFYPFIFNTSFGVDGNLAIFKKDTTYIDVIKNFGIQYALSGNNFIKVFINDKQSDLQSAKGLENISVLPEYADVTTVSYGGTFHYEKLDYRLNPRKGFTIEISASAGNRKIRKNSEINKSVYDGIDLKSTSYHAEFIGDLYFTPGGRHVFDFGNLSGTVYNENLFVNELYRIGGLKTLRGFDEESIFAAYYTIAKIEYRYLLEQNSFLFTFFNMAWYKNKSRTQDRSDNPYGFGGGINFETKIGIMSVSYALGKQLNNPILLRNGKIHFGIVNYF